jgi:ACS family hexuronate transporter-like MFS transporter
VFSYAFGQAIFGKIFDKIGTRLGFAVSITVWSIATALHSLAKGVASFALFRAVLGVAEAGNWPGAAKANAEWFPSKERAFAQGIFNSGAAIGGIIAIPLIAFLSVYFGWKAIFILIGLAGLLWLVPWLYIVKAPPERHPWISAKERDYIINNRSGTPEPVSSETEYDPSTAELLSHKQSWGVILASAAIDPIWWLFVFWIPIYLSEVFGMDVKQIGIYGWVPYVGAMFGAWFGGGLAQWMMTKGWSLNATRKSVISLGCLIMLPSFLLMSDPGTPFNAVMIMAVILFGFQTAIGNVQTLPSDLFGGKPVGTLAGFAGMSAKLGAAALTSLVPWLTAGGNYTPAFVIGAALAITAMMSILVLCPKVERLEGSH